MFSSHGGHLNHIKPIASTLMKVEKKINLISIFFLFYPPTLNIISFVENNNIFLRFCLCIFESDTVKSDCPVLDL